MHFVHKSHNFRCNFPIIFIQLMKGKSKTQCQVIQTQRNFIPSSLRLKSSKLPASSRWVQIIILLKTLKLLWASYGGALHSYHLHSAMMPLIFSLHNFFNHDHLSEILFQRHLWSYEQKTSRSLFLSPYIPPNSLFLSSWTFHLAT